MFIYYNKIYSLGDVTSLQTRLLDASFMMALTSSGDTADPSEVTSNSKSMHVEESFPHSVAHEGLQARDLVLAHDRAKLPRRLESVIHVHRNV